MSGAALSIKPVPSDRPRDNVLSEIQADPDEILDFVQVGDTAFILFASDSVRDRIEFLNGSDLFDSVATVQRETMDTFRRMKNPEPPKPAAAPQVPKPVVVHAPVIPSGDNELLAHLQTKTMPPRAKLPDNDAYSILSNNFGLVTLAILTVLAFSSLLG